MFRNKKGTTPWELNVKCNWCSNKFTLKNEEDILRVETMLPGLFFERYHESFITSCPKCKHIHTIPKILIRKEIRQKCLNLCD